MCLFSLLKCSWQSLSNRMPQTRVRWRIQVKGYKMVQMQAKVKHWSSPLIWRTQAAKYRTLKSTCPRAKPGPGLLLLSAYCETVGQQFVMPCAFDSLPRKRLCNNTYSTGLLFMSSSCVKCLGHE